MIHFCHDPGSSQDDGKTGNRCIILRKPLPIDWFLSFHKLSSWILEGLCNISQKTMQQPHSNNQTFFAWLLQGSATRNKIYRKDEYLFVASFHPVNECIHLNFPRRPRPNGAHQSCVFMNYWEISHILAIIFAEHGWWNSIPHIVGYNPTQEYLITASGLRNCACHLNLVKVSPA